MNAPGPLPLLQERSQGVYCSPEEGLHALVQSHPGQELWKVYSKQLAKESCKLLQGWFALISDQLLNTSTTQCFLPCWKP